MVRSLSAYKTLILLSFSSHANTTHEIVFVRLNILLTCFFWFFVCGEGGRKREVVFFSVKVSDRVLDWHGVAQQV